MRVCLPEGKRDTPVGTGYSGEPPVLSTVEGHEKPGRARKISLYVLIRSV